MHMCTYNEIKLGGKKMIEQISKELKATRIRMGLEIEDVASYMNLSYETIRKYESGKYNYSLETLEKILNYYKVSPRIFFENVCAYMHEK